jgi:hypothetical protein
MLSLRRLERSNELMEQRLRTRRAAVHRQRLADPLILDATAVSILERPRRNVVGSAQGKSCSENVLGTDLRRDLEVARNLFNERRTGDRKTRNVTCAFSRKTRDLTAHIHNLSDGFDGGRQLHRSDERTRENFIGSYGVARDISAEGGRTSHQLSGATIC